MFDGRGVALDAAVKGNAGTKYHFARACIHAPDFGRRVEGVIKGSVKLSTIVLKYI